MRGAHEHHKDEGERLDRVPERTVREPPGELAQQDHHDKCEDYAHSGRFGGTEDAPVDPHDHHREDREDGQGRLEGGNLLLERKLLGRLRCRLRFQQRPNIDDPQNHCRQDRSRYRASYEYPPDRGYAR